MENIRSCLVIGDDPDIILSKYDKLKKVKPYVKYKKVDAHNLKQKHLELLSTVINGNNNLKNEQKELIKKRADALSLMIDDDYFNMISSGLEITENGDAISVENPDGKITSYKIGGEHVIPFITNENLSVFSSLKSDILWDTLNTTNSQTYEIAWDLYHGKSPSSQIEKQIYDNMRPFRHHFAQFETKEEYIKYNTSFWTFAVATIDKWVDMDASNNTKDWILNYYERFILKLSPDTKLTIVEYI